MAVVVIGEIYDMLCVLEHYVVRARGDVYGVSARKLVQLSRRLGRPARWPAARELLRIIRRELEPVDVRAAVSGTTYVFGREALLETISRLKALYFP